MISDFTKPFCMTLLVLSVGCSSGNAQQTPSGLPSESTHMAASRSSFFLSPRFAVLILADDVEFQQQLQCVLNRENFREVIEELSINGNQSLALQNVLTVANVHSMQWEFEAFRSRVEQKAIDEKRHVTEEELDHGLLEHVQRTRSISEAFRQTAQQGLVEAKINFLTMLRAIDLVNQSMPTWNGTIGENISIENLSVEKQQLHSEVIKLLELRKYGEEAKREVDLLVANGYWPAIEGELRALVQTNAGVSKIETLTDKLSRADELDSISNACVATHLLRVALAKKETPPLGVMQFAEKARQQGSLEAYRVLFDYYIATGNDAKAEQVLSQGSDAGQLDCIFKMACRYYAKCEYVRARDLFVEALSRGVAVSTVYLGMIYEIGGEGVNKEMAEAIAYYNQGAAANIPEAIERIGHLYATDVLEAEVAKLDYQIPGWPRIPEPTAQQEQRLANLYRASARFESASKEYKKQGDDLSVQRVTQYSQFAKAEIGSINASVYGLPKQSDIQNWHERDNRRLDRNFELQIDLRNQDRLDTEERNRRYDKMLNQ